MSTPALDTATGTDILAETKEWKAELIQCKHYLEEWMQELAIVINKNSLLRIDREIKHFNGLFMRNRIMSCGLLSELKAWEKVLAYQFFDILHIDEKLLHDHKILGERMVAYRKLHHELKTEFQSFIENWE